MGSMSLLHWLIVAMLVILLFGRGKLSGLMGDAAKGIKAFRAGMRDDEPTTTAVAEPERKPNT